MSTSMSSAVRYSGRTSRPPNHREGRKTSAKGFAGVPANSPVWWMAAAVFVIAWLTHGAAVGTAAVIGQLAIMTALQWAIILYQRGLRAGRPHMTIPMLRAARWGTFLLAMGAILVA